VSVPPKVVIIDDHEVVRKGIRTSLEQEAGVCEVVGEAGTVAQARTLIEETSPDVAVLDVVLPDGDGIHLCREICARQPHIACVLLTSFPESRGMLSAAMAGASAYLAKDGSSTDLVTTVLAVARGERLLDPARMAVVLDELAAGGPGDDPLLRGLTRQERRVFELIGLGLSNRQIAGRLHLTERTIKNYSSRLMGKLQVERRSEAAILSARLSERRAQQRARGGSVHPEPFSPPPAG
jgi:two-component system, NarL family, response regulator DevR